MFTIKFYSFFDDDATVEVNITCPHYEVYTRKNGVKSVIVYKDFTSVDGVEYWVADKSLEFEKQHYHVCYVENAAGKTINKF